MLQRLVNNEAAAESALRAPVEAEAAVTATA